MSERGRRAAFGGIGGRGEEEAGRIGLLMGVCLLIVVSFLFVSATVTAVAIEDRRLLACADRLSVATAGIIDASAYYGGAGRVEVVVSARAARGAAERALEALEGSVCDVGAGVSIVEVEREAARVRVGVRARAVLPIVPGVLQGVGAPVLVRESTARVAMNP